ncbi:MAG TPA: helix-turn-helix transcriptional regulator [Proteiniclasticum sp.]|nr:helix-turn-helix transcriptional regulator [Proteiniclasticum sp.]
MSKTGVSYKIIKEKLLESDQVRQEYDALEFRYKIVKKIAELRKNNKITQEELAIRLKTTKSVVSRIESGNQNVSVDMVQKIVNALGKEVDIVIK